MMFQILSAILISLPSIHATPMVLDPDTDALVKTYRIDHSLKFNTRLCRFLPKDTVYHKKLIERFKPSLFFGRTFKYKGTLIVTECAKKDDSDDTIIFAGNDYHTRETQEWEFKFQTQLIRDYWWNYCRDV